MGRRCGPWLVGVGLALVSVALGFVYLDVREVRLREQQLEAMAIAAHGEPGVIDESAAEDLDATVRNWLVALAAGTVGVGLLGFGGTAVLLELRWFRRE